MPPPQVTEQVSHELHGAHLQLSRNLISAIFYFFPTLYHNECIEGQVTCLPADSQASTTFCELLVAATITLVADSWHIEELM